MEGIADSVVVDKCGYCGFFEKETCDRCNRRHRLVSAQLVMEPSVLVSQMLIEAEASVSHEIFDRLFEVYVMFPDAFSANALLRIRSLIR